MDSGTELQMKEGTHTVGGASAVTATKIAEDAFTSIASPGATKGGAVGLWSGTPSAKHPPTTTGGDICSACGGITG